MADLIQEVAFFFRSSASFSTSLTVPGVAVVSASEVLRGLMFVSDCIMSLVWAKSSCRFRNLSTSRCIFSTSANWNSEYVLVR